MTELVLHLDSERISLEIGKLLGSDLEPGDIVALWGELGAGKTFMAQAIARGLGIPESVPVTSPTFTIINEYHGRLHLYHLDLYRISDPEELETLPWREALFGDGAALIEWPDRLGPLLPDQRLDLHLTITGDQTRQLSLAPRGNRYQGRFIAWRKRLAAVNPKPRPANNQIDTDS
jgi:tRNA threonylcarbamoyladenosine biosynthesis protein TsaE